MANTTNTYRRDEDGRSETVTIMAHLGDGDEIRRIVERDGVVVQDGIAYFGVDGRAWPAEQHTAYVGDGFLVLPGA